MKSIITRDLDERCKKISEKYNEREAKKASLLERFDILETRLDILKDKFNELINRSYIMAIVRNGYRE